MSAADGYFRVGPSVTAYGRYGKGDPSPDPDGALPDALDDAFLEGGAIHLPFDADQAAENLQCELYTEAWPGALPVSVVARLYYFVRPLLPVGVRRHLQKIYLGLKPKRGFPHWPVDSSVDDMFAKVLLLALEAGDLEEIPFIWFWPEGARCGAVMTHDVETRLGRDWCKMLMDIDDAFGIKSSFNVIPEQRYEVSSEFLESIRSRGFEIGVHDLNHDGHLFRDRAQFLERVARINEYGRTFQAEGFRAAALYRKQVWYDALDFAFDMSVPNVATYDPQQGGCCTVLPYFIGEILELPLTMSQDYTIFNIFDDYSTDVWKQQLDVLLRKNGLISCIVHPDYLTGPRERKIYEELLALLAQLREEQGVWIARPKEVNAWWRARDQMSLVQTAGAWRIEGPESHRARVAFARKDGDQLAYRLQEEQGGDDLSPEAQAFTHSS
jgi:hypothetical protein